MCNTLYILCEKSESKKKIIKAFSLLILTYVFLNLTKSSHSLEMNAEIPKIDNYWIRSSKHFRENFPVKFIIKNNSDKSVLFNNKIDYFMRTAHELRSRGNGISLVTGEMLTKSTSKPFISTYIRTDGSDWRFLNCFTGRNKDFFYPVPGCAISYNPYDHYIGIKGHESLETSATVGHCIYNAFLQKRKRKAKKTELMFVYKHSKQNIDCGDSFLAYIDDKTGKASCEPQSLVYRKVGFWTGMMKSNVIHLEKYLN